MKTDLAIIVPVLNCLDYTKQMIPTIKTKRPYNLILIDNGSTDGTRDYFHELAKDKRVWHLSRDENIGVSGAWNEGVRFAKNELDARLFFIPNNDAILHPDCIDILADAVEGSNIGLVSATDVSGQVPRVLDTLTQLVPAKEELVDAPDFSCFLIKLETFLRIGYFDKKFFPAYFEDNDYHYRLKLGGMRGVKSRRALYYHFGSRTIKSGAKISDSANLGYTINRDYYRQKWGGLPGHEKFTEAFGGK